MTAAWRFPAAVVAGGLLAILVPQLVGVYYVSVALGLCMWIALTQSWTILSGMAGYISLGHVVFYGLGGYVAVVTWQVLPLWVAIPLAGAVAGLFAAIIGAPVLRVRGPYFVILTFGIAELVKYIVIDVEASIAQGGRLMFGTPGVPSLYYVMLGLAVAGTLLAWAVRRSRLGAGLIAIREDEPAAETIGVPVARFKSYAFILSAVIPGMVGAVMGLRQTYVEVLQLFDPVVSFTIVTMAIIGGSDDARGPLFGAAFLVVLSELLWSNLPQLYMVILGALLVCFVLFAPNGIVGLVTRRRPAPS
jgi:branched-chain amino acid transport system permease protein